MALSKAYRSSLVARISRTVRAPDSAALYDALRRLIERHCSMRHGVADFLANVALLTLGSMLVMLALFLLRRPGALQAPMWAQFLFQGFPVTFLVNLAAASFYSALLDRLTAGTAWRSLLTMLGDAVARMLLFIAFTALSFLAWARVNGAFGGDPAIALASVATTLRYGILFQSLTGVYLYSTVLSAFPFFALFFIRIVALSRTRPTTLSRLIQVLPMKDLPLGMAFAFFVVSVCLVMLTTFAALRVFAR